VMFPRSNENTVNGIKNRTKLNAGELCIDNMERDFMASSITRRPMARNVVTRPHEKPLRRTEWFPKFTRHMSQFNQLNGSPPPSYDAQYAEEKQYSRGGLGDRFKQHTSQPH